MIVLNVEPSLFAGADSVNHEIADRQIVGCPDEPVYSDSLKLIKSVIIRNTINNLFIPIIRSISPYLDEFDEQEN